MTAGSDESSEKISELQAVIKTTMLNAWGFDWR